MVTSAELLKLRDRLLSLTQLASARCLRAPSIADDNRQLVLDLESARADLLGFLETIYKAAPTTAAEAGNLRQLLADTKSTADRLLEASRVVLELARRHVN